MNTRDLNTFDKLLDDQRDANIDAIKSSIKIIEGQRKFAPVLKRIRHFYQDASVWVLGGCIHFDCDVKIMKDIEPALAFFEEELGVKFSDTRDSAGEKLATRTYTTECGTLIVNASVKGDSPTCRSVPDGEEVVKKYKLVCDDDAEAGAGGDL